MAVDPKKLMAHVRALAAIGPRLMATDKEREGAEYFARAMQKAGAETWLETFPVVGWQPGEAEVSVRQGRKWLEVPALTLGFSPPTKGRVESKVVVIDHCRADNPQLRECAGKVVLCAALWGEDGRDLDALTKAKPAAIFFIDDRYPSYHSVQINMPMGWAGRLGVPAATVSYFDGWEMAKRRPKVRVKIASSSFPAESVNAVARFEGTNSRLAPVVLGAHHDSVTVGEQADDNATGMACVIEVAKALAAKPRARTVVACSFGCEEFLSTGSEAFVRAHPEVAEKAALVVNFDSVGSVLGQTQCLVTGTAKLLKLAGEAVEGLGLPVIVERDVSPYSDHFFFTAAGTPAVWLHRPNCRAGRWYHHSDFDAVEQVGGKQIAMAADVGMAIAEEIAGATRLPYERKVPEEQLAATRKLEREMGCWPPKR